LVEVALSVLDVNISAFAILDLGLGTGAIALAPANSSCECNWSGSWLRRSKRWALRRNALRNHLVIDVLMHSSWFDA